MENLLHPRQPRQLHRSRLQQQLFYHRCVQTSPTSFPSLGPNQQTNQARLATRALPVEAAHSDLSLWRMCELSGVEKHFGLCDILLCDIF